MVDKNELARLDLNQDIAKINWVELQPHFARGCVLFIDESLDLVAIAQQMLADESVVIQRFIEQQKIYPVTDEQAQQFYDNQQVLWAIVLAPWVLVQTVKDNKE